MYEGIRVSDLAQSNIITKQDGRQGGKDIQMDGPFSTVYVLRQVLSCICQPCLVQLIENKQNQEKSIIRIRIIPQGKLSRWWNKSDDSKHVISYKPQLYYKAQTAKDRTLENQKGRSCFNPTGIASPFSLLTESYPAQSSLFHLRKTILASEIVNVT